MKITSWKIVAEDENGQEFEVDVHRNNVANLIDDFLAEQFEDHETYE